VTYSITLFLQSREPVAQRLLDNIVSGVVERQPTTSAALTGDGVGWATCDLTSDRDIAAEARALYPDAVGPAERTTPISLRVTTRPDVVRDAVNARSAQDGPEELSLCDAIAEIVLSGYLLDWTIVKAIHAVAIERWSAIGYTDQAGFDVTPPTADGT
jgi:hypothetical protein